MEPFGDRLPEDLEAVASRLRATRAEADPIQLDQIKQRVLARSSKTSPRKAAMRSRIATVATLLALIGGTGGALALAHDDHGNGNGGASGGQYRPGKGCGDRHHHHTGPPGNPSNDKCPDHGDHGDGGGHGHGHGGD